MKSLQKLPLNKEELLSEARQAARRLAKRHNKKTPAIKQLSVQQQGNFTIVTINNVIGVSKRNPKDAPNDLSGFHYALNRALRTKLGLDLPY